MKAYIVRIDVDYDEHFVGFYSSYKKATDSIKSLRLIKDATYLENVENIKTGELKTFHLLELYTDKELSMYDIDKDNIYYPKYNESMNCWEWGGRLICCC